MNKTLVGLFIVAILAIGGMLVYSVDKETNPTPDKPKVAATIYPLYSIAEEIAGNDTDVELILEPGQSPHTFDPSASLVRDLQGADIMFAAGAELDTWVTDLSKNVPGSQVIELANFVELRPFEESHDEHEDEEHADEHGDDDHEDEEHADEHGDDDHEDEEHADEHGDDDHEDEEHADEHGDDDHEDEEHGDEHEEDADHDHNHGEHDPHFWLSPDQALTLVDIMANYIAANDPENLEAYNNRAQALKEEIRAKDTEWKAAIDGLANKDLVTFHNAFGYFADHFGMNIVATFEPFPGQEPTPQYLAELTEEINEHSITTLFLEPQLSKSAIKTFAKDNNITLGTLDPLGGERGRKSYVDLIQYNIDAIVEANQ